MIFHPTQARLKAFADSELPGPARARMIRHVAACARCRAEISAFGSIRRRIADATVLPVPPGAWEAIAARRASGVRVIPPAGIAPAVAAPVGRPAPRASLHALTRAAVLLLAVAGIASAAVVTVPRLRQWLASGGGPTVAAPSATPAPAPNHAPGRSAEGGAGVGVEARDGQVQVRIERAAAGVTVRVRVVDDTLAEVVGRGAAASAVYKPLPGSVTVSDVAAGEIEVLLPRSGARARVIVDGVPLVVKEGPVLRVLSEADTAGADILFSLPTPRR